jgi:4'-phosphopantetheinyl transferase
MIGSNTITMNSLLMSEVLLKEFRPDQTFDPESTYVILISVSKAYGKVEQEYQNILSPAEIEKSGRFVNDDDRKSYVVRKCILRTLLAKYSSTDPQSIQFYTAENKKPSVEGIEFNVSHSTNFVAIALSPNNIGIDIERVDEAFDFRNLLPSCFDETESNYILSGNTLFNFYTLWTRKEALLKATGEGLIDALPLLNCLPEMIYRKGAAFRLNTCEILEGYILTLCTLATDVTEPIYLIF